MGLLQGLKAIVYKADVFYSTNLLRVKGEPEHKTLLGGVLSITMMLLLLAAFYNRIIDTLDKVIITSSASSSNANDPLAYNISTINKGPFMFGVEVWHHNLNQGPRYFDIVLTNIYYTYGEPQNTSIQYMLQPCTKEHWDGYPQVQAEYQHINMSFWKCLPKNMDFQIRGKYASQFSKTLSVAVMTCTNNSFDERPCAPQEQIDAFFNESVINYFTIYFINPLINPEQQEYLNYYLQDTNYIIFTQNGGGEGLLYIEDFTIQTDESILPNSDVRVETGGVIRTTAIRNAYSVVTDTYASFIFYKSQTSDSIVRSFQKVDNVFSYIGGLFGTILIFFFLISAYNTYKFEVDLAGYLYRCERKAEKLSKNYNFLYYLAQVMFMFLRFLRLDPKWEKVSKYYQTREEMLKQLDILYLLKRINFLEKSITYIFTEQQLKGIHLTTQLTMQDAVKKRKDYRLKSKLKSVVQSLEKNQNNDQRQLNLRETASKNKSCTQLIEYHNGDIFRVSPKTAQTSHSHSFHFDSDHYSSDESSEGDGEQLLQSIQQLRKDQQNELSKKIWNSIDGRIKCVVQKSVLTSCFKPSIVEFNEEERTYDIIENSHTKEITNFVVEQPPNSKNSKSNETSRMEEHRDIAKAAFTKLQPVKVETYNFEADEQYDNQQK